MGGAFEFLRGDQITTGYWGNHTSTIDWCELNYTHSPYVAEFINTLTNLPVILASLYGAWATWQNGIPKRYALCYLGLALVGIGSFGFHMSLRWEWQLMDELPMIYVISYSAYLVLDAGPGFESGYGWYGPLAVAAWNVFVTLSYICLPNPVYHQVAFALIMLTSTGRNILLIYRLPSNHPVKKMIIKTYAKGLLTFAGGFALWNVDNLFCAWLRKGRGYLGPAGFLLEGHGYWHLMTGYGSLLIFVASILVQLSHKVSPDAYTYNPSALIPIVYPITRPKAPTSLSDEDVKVISRSGSISSDVSETEQERIDAEKRMKAGSLGGKEEKGRMVRKESRK